MRSARAGAVGLAGLAALAGLSGCGGHSGSLPSAATSGSQSPSASALAPDPSATTGSAVPTASGLAASPDTSASAAPVSPPVTIATTPATTTPVATPTVTQVTGGALAYANARHQWQVGADQAAAIQGQYWLAAATDLSAAVSAGDTNTTGFTAAAAELRQLAALPDTSETPAQQAEARADTASLNNFFQTDGLYN